MGPLWGNLLMTDAERVSMFEGYHMQSGVFVLATANERRQ